MEDNKYKHWVFTWNHEMTHSNTILLANFLKTFCDIYVFQEEEGEETKRIHYQGYFCCKVRKRHKSLLLMFKDFCNLNNSPDKNPKYDPAYPLLLEQLTIQRMMGSQEEAIAYCTKTETRIGNPFLYGIPKKYEASDLQVFNNSVNWYPWQKDFMEIIFNKDLTLKDPDDRTIIWIQDTFGNNGKSKLVKHICYNYTEESCKLSFGSSTQLRSACITAGPKKLYFIDVPRTLGKDDDINDIISVIEDIKNGFIVSSMYGKHQQMMFDPPHIVVFANVFCPLNSLSNDRLRVFAIDYNFPDLSVKRLCEIKKG